MDISATLTRKVGPLPIGAWALIVGGGGVAWWLLSKKKAANDPATAIVTQVPVPVGAIAGNDGAPYIESPVINVDMSAFDAMAKTMQDQAAALAASAAVTTVDPAAVTGATAATATVTGTTRRSVTVLRRGSTGAKVKTLQRALNAHMPTSTPLVIDGSFGPLTDAAVRAFQTQEGIEVDGLAGPITQGRLGMS